MSKKNQMTKKMRFMNKLVKMNHNCFEYKELKDIWWKITPNHNKYNYDTFNMICVHLASEGQFENNPHYGYLMRPTKSCGMYLVKAAPGFYILKDADVE